MFSESKRRSVVKMISWRIWATLTTMILVYMFVGELKIAATVGAMETILKMGLYFVHERAWDKINFGKKLYGKI